MEYCFWCGKETVPGSQGTYHIDGTVNKCHEGKTPEEVFRAAVEGVRPVEKPVILH